MRRASTGAYRGIDRELLTSCVEERYLERGSWFKHPEAGIWAIRKGTRDPWSRSPIERIASDGPFLGTGWLCD